MLSEQQQRIMGYFIEEAKDHLNTIEQGLLNLQGTIDDPEMVNEVFRAAHSVKGGAAMLGLTSIQHTAHRLEDYFKILKECSVQIDQSLETLFLKVFDALQALLEQLQGPFGLTDDKAAEVMASAEPIFQELNSRFSGYLGQMGGAMIEEMDLGMMAAPPAAAPVREESAIQLIFQSDVPGRLREMLQVFKQPETAESRKQIQALCSVLGQYGEPHDLTAWSNLLNDVRRAIANPDNSYRVLAPIIIKEVKQAQELVLAGRSAEIIASSSLTALLPLHDDSEAEITGSEFEDLLGSMTMSSGFGDDLSLSGFDSSFMMTSEPEEAIAASTPAADLLSNDDWFTDAVQEEAAIEAASEIQFAAQQSAPAVPNASLESEFDLDFSEAGFAMSADAELPELDLSGLDESSSEPDALMDGQMGPEMGSAELNSLADLFEGEMPELGLTWQSEEIISDIQETTSSSEIKDQSADHEFSDLLFDDADQSDDLVLDDFADEDLSGLLAGSAQPQSGVASSSFLDDPLDFAGMSSEPMISDDSTLDDPFGMDLIENSSIASDEDLFGLDLADSPAAVEPEELFELDLSLDAPIAIADTATIASDELIDDPIGLDLVEEPVFVASDDPFADPFASIAEVPLEFGELDGSSDSSFDLFETESSEQTIELEPIAASAVSLLEEPEATLTPLSNEEISNFADLADLSDDSADIQELFVEELEPMEAPVSSVPSFEMEFPADELDQVSGAFFGEGLEESGLFEMPDDDSQLDASLPDLNLEIPASESERDPGFSLDDSAAPIAEVGAFELDDIWGTSAEAEPAVDELAIAEVAELQEEISLESFPDSLSLEVQPNDAEIFSLDDNSLLDNSNLEESSELDFGSLEASAELDFDGLGETAELDSNELDFGKLEASSELDLGGSELDFGDLSSTDGLDFGGLESSLDELDLGAVEPVAEMDQMLDRSMFESEQLEPEMELDSLPFDAVATEEADGVQESSVLSIDTDADWFSDEAESLPSDESESVDISGIFADDLEPTNLVEAEIAEVDLVADDFDIDISADLELAASEDDLLFEAVAEDLPAIAELEVSSPEEMQAAISDSSLDLELATLDQFEYAEAEEFIALSPTREAEDSQVAEVEGSSSGFMQGQESAGFELDFGGEGFEGVAIATPEPVVQEIIEMEAIAPESASSDFDELDLFMRADNSEPVSSSAPFELDFGEGFDLDMEPSIPDASTPQPDGSDQSLTSDPFSDSDDFSDLEAMLGESAPVPAAPVAEPETDNFDDLDALLDDAPQTTIVPAMEVAPAPSKANDEFGDLEDLLKDADQALGGGSTNRKAASAPNRRSNRRGVLTDQTMRVSVKHLDNLNNLVGEMVVNRNSLEQAQERLRQFLDNLLYQVQQLSDVGQRMRDLYERSLLESSLLSTRRSYHLKPSSTSGFDMSNGNGNGDSSNHATGESFDALEMDRFTGFHTLSQEMIELIVRVRESASDIDFVVEESDQVTRNFRQITTQLQEGLTRARMVPFAQTADRLPRGVRDNALKYGKQAELLVEGRDTLIDKMIVEQLYDPMTHLVNNAVAHGVETAEERIAAGKPAAGKIILRTFHQGNQTIISVSDDGAGIDQERVKSKAIAKGLITAAEAKEMSRMDTYDLLFHHGFSTADQIDDLKGRGVGLDVVRSNLNEIRGVISIDSTLGKGTTFTIRLPLTLSISKALCCISNRARIAFPMDGVEDMLDIPKERVQLDAQGRPCIYWRDALLPFQPLTDLLKHGRILGRGSVYGGNQEDDIISVVVLRSTGNNLALQVDQVLGEQEIVIKQLEGPVPKPIGIAGATVLGDGRIMPIADVLELIDLSEGRIRRDAGSSLWEMEEQLPPEAFTAKTEPTVLIVDDSITVRELLSMTFNKVGYRVEQARDGQEAWEKLRSGLPCDLVFCDIEMPRMDGLELLSRIQKDSSLNHLPIAMLTSRGADRHRQMAVQLGAKGYFTKPYLEEALLDAAQRMLKGEVLVMTKSSVS
jgi:chemosensory pili system protein ChpA (sensor histidine kinase/response regulator)